MQRSSWSEAATVMAMATAIWVGAVIITDGVEAGAIVTTTDYQISRSKEAASVAASCRRGAGALRRGIYQLVTATIGRQDGNRWPAGQFHMGPSKRAFARPSDHPGKNEFIGKTRACWRR